MRKQTIMIFGDTHFPYQHIDTFYFLKEVKNKYKPNQIICTGDLIDNGCINYHEKFPEGLSQTEELDKTVDLIKELKRIFPKMDILNGNHDSLSKRVARTIGLHSRYIKDNKEVFNMPKGWIWHNEFNIRLFTGQNLMIRHNLTKKAYKTAEHYNTCYAQGHYHEDFKLEWHMDKNINIWGATVGCLVDDKALAMEYNKSNLKRPELGCMIIKNGVPELIPMFTDSEGNWIGDLY